MGTHDPPDGKTAYVANPGDGTVTLIDLASNNARQPVAVHPLKSNRDYPRRDGHLHGCSSFRVISAVPIDLLTDAPGTPIALKCSAVAIAIVP
jgi:YVTN family beta-propeller protein